ncbi:TerB family tellurite resistance protein [Moorena producens JHB]|uniref:TerB family tellurite resistance protein n=1 Tax=Moorena producens (strain JHB) TaxID=1454205 RepID=A0A9Q9UW72_MOOP1|nr:TerB family tellurite resistance protein [Moorena producens]WAN69574.1 TerB family tellurite resistance protein [Moorena producens JHB]
MTIELLSHLTGRNLTQYDITPLVRFLAALVTLGMGVMYADGVVQDEEKQLLEKTIERLVPPQRDVGQLVQGLLSGLEKNPVYQNPQQWLKLTTSLSESERILLLNFCYAMSAVDGTIDPNESQYLQLASNSLGIDSRYPVVMETWFKGEEFPDQSVWEEFQSKLQPEQFEALGIRLVNQQVVEYLSHLVGRQLSLLDITPTMIFLVALVTISLEVMLADGQVVEEERQLLAKTIDRLTPPEEDDLRQLGPFLIGLLLRQVQRNPTASNCPEWLTLTKPLSDAEKLLLLCFAYDMSAADGEIDPTEQDYLHIVAKHLGIDSRYTAVLEAGFRDEDIQDEQAWDELRSQLHPDQFQYLDMVFVDAARYMLDCLEVCSL